MEQTCDSCNETIDVGEAVSFNHGVYCYDCYFELVSSGFMTPDGEVGEEME